MSNVSNLIPLLQVKTAGSESSSAPDDTSKAKKHDGNSSATSSNETPKSGTQPAKARLEGRQAGEGGIDPKLGNAEPAGDGASSQHDTPRLRSKSSSSTTKATAFNTSADRVWHYTCSALHDGFVLTACPSVFLH